jgi:hypothetical protein
MASAFTAIHKQAFPLSHHCETGNLSSVAAAAQTNYVKRYDFLNGCASNTVISTDRTFKSETNASMHLRILLNNNDTSAEQMKNIEQCNNLSFNFYDLWTII